MRKTDMYRLIEVLESFPARELRKAIKSPLVTSLKSRSAFYLRKSKKHRDCYRIGLQSGPGGFRLFGFEPLARVGARRSDRHRFLVSILENLSKRGSNVLCALLTLRSHFQSIGYALGLFSIFEPSRFVNQTSFTVTKEGMPIFRSWSSVDACHRVFLGLRRNTSKPGLLTSMFFHRFPPSSLSLILRHLRSKQVPQYALC